VGYKHVDDLATVWCEWAELELRHNQFAAALSLMRRATKQPKLRGTMGQADAPVQAWLHKNLKLWSFYCDLEESLGTLASSREVYDRMIELKIATPQIFLNYAHLLWEGKYFEDAFRVYEKGVAAFKYPHVKDLWQAYLTQFVGRYGGKKLERARDLYEQALDSAPPAETKTLFEQYAKLEEEHGLSRHAMSIYERACKTVPDAEKVLQSSTHMGPTQPTREHVNARVQLTVQHVCALPHSPVADVMGYAVCGLRCPQVAMYELYLNRAMEFFGVGKCREIFEMAIDSSLPDQSVKSLCLKYAALERRLGEIDRARALYVHSSQFADPMQVHTRTRPASLRPAPTTPRVQPPWLSVATCACRTGVMQTATACGFNVPRSWESLSLSLFLARSLSFSDTDGGLATAGGWCAGLGVLGGVEGLRSAARQRGHVQRDVAHQTLRVGVVLADALQHGGGLGDGGGGDGGGATVRRAQCQASTRWTGGRHAGAGGGGGGGGGGEGGAAVRVCERRCGRSAGAECGGERRGDRPGRRRR
jgi:tetratricopeptide (TPR) repeat protein